MEYFDVIQTRYSVRSYTKDPVPEEILNKILEAARLAPTACNRQAFKVVIIHTEGKAAELKRIYKGDWFAQAPLILGVFSIPEKSWVRADNKNYSDVDAAIVMDHIILAATALGLGTCWIGAFDSKAAKEILGLGKEYEPVAFTPLGYANTTELIKTRKSMNEIVIYK